jgi:hypothetical protein
LRKIDLNKYIIENEKNNWDNYKNNETEYSWLTQIENINNNFEDLDIEKL